MWGLASPLSVGNPMTACNRRWWKWCCGIDLDLRYQKPYTFCILNFYSWSPAAIVSIRSIMRPICRKSLWHIERTEGFICYKDRERQISRAKNTEPSNIKYFLWNGSWNTLPPCDAPQAGEKEDKGMSTAITTDTHIFCQQWTSVVFTDPSVQNCLESPSLKSFEDMATTNTMAPLYMYQYPMPHCFWKLQGGKGWLEDPQ